MIRKHLFLYFFLFPSVLFSQISDPTFKKVLDKMYKHTVPLITIDSLKNLKNVYLLDAREKTEFDVSHLKYARNVGYLWFDMRDIYDIPKNETIVVYCSVGYRSEKIGEKLIKEGYVKVYNLYGSIFEWINQGNPVYKTNGIQTSEIHTYNKNWSKWVKRGTKIY